MATYKQIQDDLRAWHSRAVKTCWIAHVKELNGFSMRAASNRRSPNSREYPCPPKMKVLIEASMRRFGMLPN